MSAFADQLLAFGLQASLLGIPLTVGLLLALRLAKGAPPRARYLVSCAVFLAVPLAAIAFRATPGVETDLQTNRVLVATPSSATPSNGGRMPLGSGLTVIWLAVTTMLLMRETGGHLLLRHRSASWERGTHTTRDGHEVPIRISESGVPMTVGLLRPRIVLPRRALSELDSTAIDSIVAHEAAHARWRDPLVHAVVRVTRFVLWPVLPLHVVAHSISREAEIASDYAACDARCRLSVSAYASTLLETARWQRSRESLVPSLTRIGLEARVRRLLEGTGPSLFGSIIGIAMLALAALATAESPLVRPDHSAVLRSVASASGSVGEVDRPRPLLAPNEAEESAPSISMTTPEATPLSVMDRDEPMAVLADISTVASDAPGVAAPDLPTAVYRPIEYYPSGLFALDDRSPPDDDVIPGSDDERVVIRHVIRTR